jgi:hypothetical protein
MCELLLSKGADVSARDFSERQETAFGLICRESTRVGTGEVHASLISETLQILLTHGHDIVTSHEVDNDLYDLLDDRRGDHEVRQARIRTAMAILYHYLWSISCNGTRPIVDVHQHTQECLLLYVTAYANVVDAKDFTLKAVATTAPQTLQAVFLRYIYTGSGDLEPSPDPLLIKLTDTIGNMHYQALFWVKNDHGDWMSRTTSPLDLALQSINSWFLLQAVINSTRISWPEFIEVELKLPDCKWNPNALRALSKMSYLHFLALDMDWQILEWLWVRKWDEESPTLSRLVRWDKVVTDLKQGISLNSVEYEIQQRIEQFSIFVAHGNESELDGDTDSESGVDADP